MIVTRWEQAKTVLRQKSCSVVLGVFDGVHRGHIDLLSRAQNEPDAFPVVITFRNHPASLLAPEGAPPLLMTLQQRVEALERAGIGACVLIDFTDDFQRIRAKAFLEELSAKMQIVRLIVGFNFRCGYRMEYGHEEIRAHFKGTATRVEVAGAVLVDDEPISSSRLRGVLARGDLAEYLRISGREYALDLRGVVPTDQSSPVRLEIAAGRLIATGQAVPSPGSYRAVFADSNQGEIDLEVASHYLEGSLAASSSLLYIVRN